MKRIRVKSEMKRSSNNDFRVPNVILLTNLESVFCSRLSTIPTDRTTNYTKIVVRYPLKSKPLVETRSERNLSRNGPVTVILTQYEVDVKK